jgi:hypothetical protein
MAAELRAVELTGVVDDTGRLIVDEQLRSVPPGRVRLIVLAPGQRDEVGTEHDLDEREWLAAAAANPAFAFLRGEAEDVYTAQDGQPFRDEG